jgi:hypothetical protein
MWLTYLPASQINFSIFNYQCNNLVINLWFYNSG